MISADQHWGPAQATELVKSIASDPESSLTWRRHASQRLHERGLIMSDVLFVLKNGFVREPSEGESSAQGLFK